MRKTAGQIADEVLEKIALSQDALIQALLHSNVTGFRHHPPDRMFPPATRTHKMINAANALRRSMPDIAERERMMANPNLSGALRRVAKILK